MKYLLACLTAVLFIPEIVHAEPRTSYDLLDNSVPVVRMERGFNREQFQTSVQPVSITEFVGATPEQEARIMNDIEKHIQRLPQRLEKIITLPKLGECQAAKEVALPVYTHTRGTEHFDFIFYDPTEATQELEAKKWGARSVPYVAGQYYGANSKQKDPRPLLALSLGVRCLPARIHFGYQDKQRFIFYREGEQAWKESDRDQHLNDYQ